MRVGTPVLVAWHRACAGGVSRVSRVLHFVFTLGRGQSSACPGPRCVSCPTHPVQITFLKQRVFGTAQAAAGGSARDATA